MSGEESAAQRGESVRARRLALGMAVQPFAEKAGIDRNTVAKAERGEASPATYGRLELALAHLEDEMGYDRPPEPLHATIDLPDGSRVTFSGGSPQDVAAALSAFLRAEGV